MIKHERDVPDNFQTILEYPDKNLTVIYSATLTNSNYRGKKFMGHDATMEVGSGLTVTLILILQDISQRLLMEL